MTTTIPFNETEGDAMTRTVDSLGTWFSAGFGGGVTTPADPGYDAGRAVWNGAIDAHPALIAH